MNWRMNITGDHAPLPHCETQKLEIAVVVPQLQGRREVMVWREMRCRA